MFSTTDFRNGLKIEFGGDPYVIVYFQHVKPGKGGAFVRTKLKNLKTGSVLEHTFRSGDKVDKPDLEEREMKILGAEEPSFRVIVASGPRSAFPHAEPAGDTIGRNDAVVIDFGARRRGYCSDETVSVLPARPASSLRRMFDAVRRAQERGIRAVRPGVPCREVDARVRESLDRAGYLKYFVHSTGHGVGLDIHERPSLSPRSMDRLAEGMVVTVEPGVYIPGVGGIRIEDMIRVTGTRGERVTYLPKKSPLFS